MEHEVSWLPWLIPAFPLLGYLFIAFFGRAITGAPRPVVEAGGHGAHGHATTTAPAHNAGPSDAPEFTVDTAVSAAGHDDTHSDAHGAHDDHGHHEAHLSPGGTKIIGGIATVMVTLSFLVSCYLFMNLNQGHAATAIEVAPSMTAEHGGAPSMTAEHGEAPAMTAEHGAATATAAAHDATPRIYSTSVAWMIVPVSQTVAAAAGENAAGNETLHPLNLNFQLAVDPLTCLMLLIITGIGALIHLYSTGYMSHDIGYARYFGYLNLFVFFMLLLVMGSNFLVMFVGWEGVGLASYLLIGFWYTRKSATDAGKKAFIVNRIGDFAFLIALFLIFKHYGTFEMFGPEGVLTNAPRLLQAGMFGGAAVSILVPLLMFIGATGKSAQIPLYVWLPDAMEGPTPVSALIHAATMVTAGVYMVCRAHALFIQAPSVMMVVAIVGLATALMAATIGLVQNDIKKVLAYSTVSQLGYMFLACGVGAFGIAMFHVTTHAFFKALLFLGSGSVIHAMGGEQDMRKMGGLGTLIKVTWATMLIGTLAIAGIPGLSGFFSKDEILLNAYLGPEQGGFGHPILWAVGFFVSGLTAFYMVRMMMKTFAGEPRMTEEVRAHVHESPISMTLPLVVLAVLSALGGFLNPAALAAFGIHGNWLHTFEHFLGPTTQWREASGLALDAHSVELPLVIASSVLAIVVCLVARQVYLKAKNGALIPDADKAKMPVWRTLYNKYYVDEAYIALFVAGGKRLSNWLWRFFDVRVIDGMVNGVAASVGALSNGIRGWQSGYVRNYALSMTVGVILVVIGCLIGLSGIIR